MRARGFVRLRRCLRLRWPIRSAGVNFSLAYGAVFVVSAALFLSFIWWNTTGRLDRAVEASVEVDAKDLREHWLLGGLPRLVLAVQDRLDQNVEDDELYLVIGPDGRRYGGNLPGWPAVINQTDRFYELPIRRDGFRAQAKFRAYVLPDGYRLLVGRDVHGRELLRHILTDTMIWVWVMVTLLAAGGGFVVRRIFRQVVHSIARTTAAVASGDLSRRMRLTGNETDFVAETVNTMLERINRLMDGVKQVSNAIAHDLRTPIARARTRLEDASLHATSEGELRAAVDRAVEDLDHVTSIFEALLRIAQLEAGARRAAFTVLDLAPLLGGLCELYEASAEEAGLSLVLRTEFPAEGTVAQVEGDAQLLQQAIANLLDNAIKFSGPRTTVTLLAQRQQGCIAISVVDQGPGMSESDLARASERFFRADQARNTPGSGLGLSLVQAVASLHGGSLALASAEPGLRATLLLPEIGQAGAKH